MSLCGSLSGTTSWRLLPWFVTLLRHYRMAHMADRSEVVQYWADHCNVYGDGKWAWLSHLDVERFRGFGVSKSRLCAFTTIIHKPPLIPTAQASYASNILFVAALWASKSATTSLVIQLNPFGWEAKVVHSTTLLLTVWAFTSIFASAFQCSLPRPWQYLGNTCFDRVRHRVGR
jgi:hypothetical protein